MGGVMITRKAKQAGCEFEGSGRDEANDTRQSRREEWAGGVGGMMITRQAKPRVGCDVEGSGRDESNETRQSGRDEWTG